MSVNAKKVTAAAGAALTGTVVLAPGADAATFNVTSLADDGSPGTLRDAIDQANAADGDDVITFQAGLAGTITLASGDLNVNSDGLDIQGPGPSQITIDAHGDSRIFYIANMDATNEPVGISGLTMTGGDVTGGYIGGALYSDDGAVGEAANLTVANAVMTGNKADGGGAIWAENGSIRIVDSVLTNNEATLEHGGALYLRPEDPPGLVIENTNVSGNRAELYGGGLHIRSADYDVRIERSTFASNSASFGGGIYLDEADVDMTLVNSTVSGNSAIYGGGAMWVDPGEDHDVTVLNTTVAGNSAYYGGGIFLEEEGPDNGSVAISSSIIADNTRNAAAPYANADLSQDSASLGTISAGTSLIEAGGGFLDDGSNNVSLIESPAGSNLLGVDPQLGPLQANGGPTPTQAPAVGSPVVEAGIANGLATDQRGAPRTFDAANFPNRVGSDGTDMGALELLPGGRASLAQCKGVTETVLFAPGIPIVGTDANDVIVGTDAADNVNSGAGADLICVGNGNDAVTGGAGKDRAFGEAGKDRVKGNGGNDKLQGNAGKDTLKGGGGKDTLKGGGGKDKLRGGPGKDKLKGGGGRDSEVQ